MSINFRHCNYELNKITGSMLATTIFLVLENEFKKQVKGFYKFIEPCSHDLYREGYSFSEETGCHRKSFWRAFKKIGIKYNSCREFGISPDIFRGKFFASIYDRNTNLTVFLRNHELVSNTLRNIPQSKNKVDDLTLQSLLKNLERIRQKN